MSATHVQLLVAVGLSVAVGLVAGRRPDWRTHLIAGTGLGFLVLVVGWWTPLLLALIALAFVVGQRDADPLNGTDVGFMQDMGYHHDQALQLSLLLLAKDDVDPALKAFAQEIIIGQRYEQGVFSATLDRYGHLYPEADRALRDRLDALYVAGAQVEPGVVIELRRDALRPQRGPGAG